MRVFVLLQHVDIVHLDVQELVHGNQRSLDRQIVLQLDRDDLPD
jgi:hypothetical protein